MIESDFFTNIRTWVYVPFVGAFTLLSSFFWWIRVADRKDRIDGHTEIKEILKENTAAIGALNVQVARLDERFNKGK